MHRLTKTGQLKTEKPLLRNLDYFYRWHTNGCQFGTNSMNPSVQAVVRPFMATMYPSSNGYIQYDNAPCQKAKVISNWFHEHDNELNVLQWPS